MIYDANHSKASLLILLSWSINLKAPHIVCYIPVKFPRKPEMGGTPTKPCENGTAWGLTELCRYPEVHRGLCVLRLPAGLPSDPSDHGDGPWEGSIYWMTSNEMNDMGDIPIGSMVLLYMVTLCNIYHQYIPNVSIYTIHGSYGIW